MKRQMKWAYSGVVTRFGRPYATISKEIVTTAPSQAKAEANFLGRLKRQFGLAYDARLELAAKPRLISIIEEV